jgi:hypothetical protein
VLLLVVVSRAKHLRSATILEEDVEDEDEDEDDVEAKPLAATRRANMNFLMEQKHFGKLPHKVLSRVAIGYFVYERHVCNEDDDDDDDDKCTPTRRG